MSSGESLNERLKVTRTLKRSKTSHHIHSILCESLQGRSQVREILDEPTVEIGETKKTVQLFFINRVGSGSDGIQLSWIHSQPSGGDDEA